MINVYLAGDRKKNRYTPSESVFVDWCVPLALSLISTSALGTTALLWSVTTPINPPEVVVWAINTLDKSIANRRRRKTKSSGQRLRVWPGRWSEEAIAKEW
jgi:hypothetical protein